MWDFVQLESWSVLFTLSQKLNWPQKGSSEVPLGPGDLLWFPSVGIWSRFSTVSINTFVSVSLPNQLPFLTQGEARDQTFLHYGPIRHYKGREQVWQSKWCVYGNLERARLNQSQWAPINNLCSSLCGLDWNVFLFRVVQAGRDQRVKHLWMCTSLQSHCAQWEDSGKSTNNFPHYCFVAWFGVGGHWKNLQLL